jgi:outer membrane protein TolC
MKTVLTILITCLPILAGAQTPTEEMAIDKVKPLKELIELAVAYAPSIDVLTTGQDLKREEMDITKKKWLQHFSVAAGVNYGNGIMADQLTNGTGTDNTVTYLTRQNVTYSVGLNIRLPFSEVASRKNEIKIKKLEIEQLEYKIQDMEKMITEEVIKRYNSLSICLKSVALKTEVAEANEMAMKVAENYFKAAKLSIEEYRSMLDKTYTSKLELEKSKSDAWYCIKSLNTIVGQSILK